MARKKWIWLFLGLAAAGISSLLLVHLRPEKERPVPSLLSRPLRVDAALFAGAWQSVAAQRGAGEDLFP